jgi:hypothetical protein
MAIGIATAIRSHPNVAIAAVIEPGAVADIVLHSDKYICLEWATWSQRAVAYALANLNLNNTALYLDVSHGGVLGWTRTFSTSPNNLNSVLKYHSRI